MWIVRCPACGATLAPPGDSAVQSCWNCGWKSEADAPPPTPQPTMKPLSDAAQRPAVSPSGEPSQSQPPILASGGGKSPAAQPVPYQVLAKNRVVRVFVSSTFRDMHRERDILTKHVFPQLRKLCEERGVGFVDVDLRWGVTEEQTQRGEVLPICLAEIDRCRPYFIGLLSERYGWVPEPGQIPQELIDDQPWLVEHIHKSVTELEIVPRCVA